MGPVVKGWRLRGQLVTAGRCQRPASADRERLVVQVGGHTDSSEFCNRRLALAHGRDTLSGNQKDYGDSKMKRSGLPKAMCKEESIQGDTNMLVVVLCQGGVTGDCFLTFRGIFPFFNREWI